MRFTFGCTDEQWLAEQARLENWHRWWAWRPVHVHQNEYRWLEMVERKGFKFAGEPWGWDYRAITRTKDKP